MGLDQKLASLQGLLAGISIQVGLDIPEGVLVSTEPAVLDDECSVVGLAPAKGGMVGLDADTGRPMQLGWKYKSIDEKPVIIHNGARQTVIPPVAKPAPPPPAPKLPPVTAAEAGELYNAVHGPVEATEVGVRRAFVAACLADPAFYTRCRDRLGQAAPVEDLGRPGPPRVRQRVVDT
jgi:hypothetical protein